MALALRRSSDWSVVLKTENGQQISFDRQNRRIRTSVHPQPGSTRATAAGPCPLCRQALPPGFVFADPSETEAQRSSFVHPEYFGLLAACLEEEHAVENEEEEEFNDHLSAESFNQGYCQRFFVEEGFLGRGGRGEVIKVRHILEGVSLGVFALKRVAVGDCQSVLIQMLREVQSLRFKHPNLVSYNHVWLERSQGSTFGPRVPVLHILQEFCDGGDLESHVFKVYGKVPLSNEELKARQRRRSRGQLPVRDPVPQLDVETVYSYFRDILAGLTFLHEQGMIHRDMKTSNCLLDSHHISESGIARVLVSDFGEAQLAAAMTDHRSGGTGTLSYLAPEIIRGQAWTQAADMFSLGMILYFLTHEGSLPYTSADDDLDGLRQEILCFSGFPLPHTQDSSTREDSRELKIVLSKLLDPNPANRPSCGDLMLLMQLHDQKLPQRPVFRSRHSSMRSANTVVDNKWPQALPTTLETSLILSRTETAVSPIAKIDLQKSLGLARPSRAIYHWINEHLHHVLRGKDEQIALMLLVLRIVILANILSSINSQMSLELVLLPIALQAFEHALGLTISARMSTTLAFSATAWILAHACKRWQVFLS